MGVYDYFHKADVQINQRVDVEYIGQAVKGNSTAGYCFWINCLNFPVNLVPLNLIPRSVRKHLENVEITLNRVARLCQEYILLT